MIIKSSFEDYYDGQQAYGVDDNVVYERKLRQHVIDPRLIQSPELVSILRLEEDDDIPGIGLLGVCGLGFPVRTDINAYRLSEPRCPGWLPSGSLLGDFSYFWDSTQSLTEGIPIGDAVFEQLSSPTFLVLAKAYRDDWITFSGIQLKAFGFQKVLTPFDTFVSIRNYLVNVLAQRENSPRTVGDDKTIARQKGFDDKSFRQSSPGNKKLNRAANRHKRKGTQ